MRLATRPSEPALKAILDPRRVLRWVFIGRLCLASAIFIAAVGNWTSVDADQTLVASIAFALATAVTVVSAGYVEIYHRRPTANFLYLQAAFDTLLVTAVVHVTNGNNSPFSGLYVLVIAIATLIVPPGGGLLIAALGLVLYLADVLLFFRLPADSSSRRCGSSFSSSRWSPCAFATSRPACARAGKGPTNSSRRSSTRGCRRTTSSATSAAA